MTCASSRSTETPEDVDKQLELANQIINEIVDEENAAIDGPPCEPFDHEPDYGTIDGRPRDFATCKKCLRYLRREDSASPWVVYGVRERANKI